MRLTPITSDQQARQSYDAFTQTPSVGLSRAAIGSALSLRSLLALGFLLTQDRAEALGIARPTPMPHNA
jgi:hypothetical protein